MGQYRTNAAAVRDLVRETEVHRDVYVDQEIFELESCAGTVRVVPSTVSAAQGSDSVVAQPFRPALSVEASGGLLDHRAQCQGQHRHRAPVRRPEGNNVPGTALDSHSGKRTAAWAGIRRAASSTSICKFTNSIICSSSTAASSPLRWE